MANETRKMPKGSEKISVPLREAWVRVIVLDMRGEKKQFELLGKMEIPMTLSAGNVFVNWRFDELVEPVRGLVMDPQASGINIAFPFVDEDDAISSSTGKPISFDELKEIFMKHNPKLKLQRKR